MQLQAFIDDSGSEPQSPAFVLAGYVTSKTRWARFAVDWRDVLNDAPSVAYFKASEAMSLRGEFSKRKGWTDAKRDGLVIELSRVIANHALLAVSATIQYADWDHTIRKLPTLGPWSIINDHPYVYLWWIMLRELWLHPTKRGLGSHPCEFVFDRQIGFEDAAIQVWQSMKAVMNEPSGLPREMREWIPSAPTFADDMDQLPLQAADLWAWSNRRALTHEPNQLKLPTRAMEWLTSVPAMHLPVRRGYLVAETYKAGQWLKGEVERLKARDDGA